MAKLRRGLEVIRFMMYTFSHVTLCGGCSKGCNMDKGNKLIRFMTMSSVILRSCDPSLVCMVMVMYSWKGGCCNCLY